MVSRDEAPVEASRNRLLAAMSPETIDRLSPRMQRVKLTQGEVLSEADAPIAAVHFPLSGLCSLMIRFEDGFQAEVGLIGRDGMIGVSILNGVRQTGVEAVVQIAGDALRIGAGEFREEMERAPQDGMALRRYGEALARHAMQIAACNGHHGLEQRLARWLLKVQDRVGGDHLAVTQETLAAMMCVHRPSVTVAAGRLHREMLERSACACRAALQRRILDF